MEASSLEKEDSIGRVLEKIGLHKNERAIYLDLIKSKVSSASEISKRTRIHRTNVYDALNKLISIGFISESKHLKKKLFKAVEPEKIKNYVSQLQDEVSEVVKNIKHIKNLAHSDSSDHNDVFMGAGRFAARNALTDILGINKPIYVIGASSTSADIIGIGFLNQFHKDRIKRKIPMKQIYNQDVKERIKYLNKL